MGVIRKLVFGRWAVKWLLRGSPWAVAAKLAGVALFGAWRWRREHDSETRGPREIEADYEVLDESEPYRTAEPTSGGSGTMNSIAKPSERDDIDPNPGAEDDET